MHNLRSRVGKDQSCWSRGCISSGVGSDGIGYTPKDNVQPPVPDRIGSD